MNRKILNIFSLNHYTYFSYVTLSKDIANDYLKFSPFVFVGTKSLCITAMFQFHINPRL